MAELAEKSEVLVPMTHDLKCPACHTPLEIVVVTKFDRGHARVSGGSTFSSNISVSLDSRGSEMVIAEHRCELPKAH